jgi:SAM-dependent methyltransferase
MPDLRKLFGLAVVYRAFQSAVGGRALVEYLDRYLKPTPGTRVLDIGCGPAGILRLLDPSIQYTGVDLSEAYIVNARRRFGARGRFVHSSVTDFVLSEPGEFDLVMANGVLHHLNDEEAVDLLRIAAAALRAGGRLVTIDGCYTTDQSRAARWVVSRDRGKHVRAAPAFAALARRHFVEVDEAVRHDLLRIPYSHLIMECRRPKVVSAATRIAS